MAKMTSELSCQNKLEEFVITHTYGLFGKEQMTDYEMGKVQSE